jgi:hypothetical protein
MELTEASGPMFLTVMIVSLLFDNGIGLRRGGLWGGPVLGLVVNLVSLVLLVLMATGRI